MQQHLNLVLKLQQYVFTRLSLQSAHVPLEAAEVPPGGEAPLGGIHLYSVQQDGTSCVQLCVCACVRLCILAALEVRYVVISCDQTTQ